MGLGCSKSPQASLVWDPVSNNSFEVFGCFDVGDLLPETFVL